MEFSQDKRLENPIMSKKKLIFIVPTLNKGGAERVVSLLANHFSDEFLVSVISLGSEAPQYDVKAEFISLNLGARKNIYMKVFNSLLRGVRIRKIIKRKRQIYIDDFVYDMKSFLFLMNTLQKD